MQKKDGVIPSPPPPAAPRDKANLAASHWEQGGPGDRANAGGASRCGCERNSLWGQCEGPDGPAKLKCHRRACYMIRRARSAAKKAMEADDGAVWRNVRTSCVVFPCCRSPCSVPGACIFVMQSASQISLAVDDCRFVLAGSEVLGGTGGAISCTAAGAWTDERLEAGVWGAGDRGDASMKRRHNR